MSLITLLVFLGEYLELKESTLQQLLISGLVLISENLESNDRTLPVLMTTILGFLGEYLELKNS